ncbi:MAG: hypothetical protein HQ454_05475 [Acidimicrobiaceae bacterium]|nr:hypothetical protein [Acidimicrobiaceae bacterium]
MALAELVQKMKSKRQATARSAFGHYLEAVKELASGKEIDAGEAELILAAAGKSEDDLSRDVQLQQQRITWHARCVANQQATKDRVQAERDLQAASTALQAAYDKLQPAINQAHDRLNAANHTSLITMSAEGWLAENVLDHELIEREAAVVVQLKIVDNELKPLLQDQARRQTTLENLQAHVEKLRDHASIPWLPLKMLGLQQSNEAIKSTDANVAAVRNELQQLQEAIRPRQDRQRELQAELNQIHQQKLLP